MEKSKISTGVKLCFSVYVIFAIAGALYSQESESASSVMEGRITSRYLQTFTLTCDPGVRPAVGDSCEVQKYFENQVGNMNMKGWMGVGKGVTTKSGENLVTVKMVEETSTIVINGEKVDHFKINNQMKLTWSPRAETRSPADE